MFRGTAPRRNGPSEPEASLHQSGGADKHASRGKRPPVDRGASGSMPLRGAIRLALASLGLAHGYAHCYYPGESNALSERAPRVPTASGLW